MRSPADRDGLATEWRASYSRYRRCFYPVPPSAASMATLRDWQSRLDTHFKSLSASRRALGNHALYVLEHGLSSAECESLDEDVRRAILAARPSGGLWLPWVVYAAEIGYDFAGEEYWQTYEDRTPGWIPNVDRPWLREQFRKFARRFGGAQPQGDWARHFSIICWPITHAILPRDLQQQLARALHDLRWVLQIEHLTDPLALGELIRSRSHSSSSRFATFAEDAALVGQIATALLLKDASQTSHLVHAGTLDRIASDLERERLARTWLAEARQRAAQVRLRGVAQPTRALAVGRHPERDAATALPTIAAGGGRPRPTYQRSALGIDPRLVLRRVGEGVWALDLEIPEVHHLLASPVWNDLLTRSRCRVAGGGRRPLAPGRLLHGIQRVALERWPRPDEVLLEFDNAPAVARAALTTTALLPRGPSWLFKVAADGRAYHVRSGVFRPGAEYVLLSVNPIEYDAVLRRVEVRCAGVSAAHVSVPAFMPANVEGLLGELGFSRASSIRFSPVGAPPLFWDGEGHVEWLTTDTPVVGVRRETAVESVELTLSGETGASTLIGTTEGEVVYVELPQLSPGPHSIAVRAAASDGRVVSAGLEITVRAPRPWTGTLGDQHAVQVAAAPAAATMEDLLAGRFRLDVAGPPGVRVETDVSLWNYKRERRLYRKSLPAGRLPFDMAAWRRSFVESFLDDQPVQDALDTSWAVEVALSFGGVASQRFLFVRHLAPLRWAVRTRRRERFVTLLDDTGAEGEAILQFRTFDEPDVPRGVAAAAGEAVGVPVGGGLLEASHGSERATAVLAPAGVHRLHGLQVKPRLRHYRRAPDGASQLVQLAALWAEATPQGSRMARLRQCNVLRAIHEHIVGFLCGARWVPVEHAFMAGRKSVHELVRDVTMHPGHGAIREGLEELLPALPELSGDARADRLLAVFSRAREFTSLSHPDAVLALSLMSTPERVGVLAEASWTRLLENAILMRAARFLVVASHTARPGGDITAIPLYAGWE